MYSCTHERTQIDIPVLSFSAGQVKQWHKLHQTFKLIHLQARSAHPSFS